MKLALPLLIVAGVLVFPPLLLLFVAAPVAAWLAAVLKEAAGKGY